MQRYIPHQSSQYTCSLLTDNSPLPQSSHLLYGDETGSVTLLTFHSPHLDLFHQPTGQGKGDDTPTLLIAFNVCELRLRTVRNTSPSLVSHFTTNSICPQTIGTA